MEGEAAVGGLLEHLSALADPRQACKVVYPLRDVLLVVLCGSLSGLSVPAGYWPIRIPGAG